MKENVRFYKCPICGNIVGLIDGDMQHITCCGKPMEEMIANTTDAAVLGAKRGTEFAVLGKRRRPQTGDNAAIWVWASMITLAVCGAGVSVTGLAKNKRKKEEPGK